MNGPEFDNTFAKLPRILYEEVKPTPIKNARLVHVTKLRETLGLGSLSDDELTGWLNGEIQLSGEQRIATRYAGHQFGVWAGQLGDGRAISLGEIVTNAGRLEIQTKGSGLTPFSRMGDGKAVIRSSVREYLCSEAMEGLKIPTTRVLALLIGEDKVQREEIERSAVVARVMPSNIRFGHFEMCFHFEKQEALDALIDYTRKTFFNDVSVEEMLTEVVTRTAKLMAMWMGVGFNHGVMNSDNMSIMGLTIDYGPFGFLEDTDLNYICNHSDQQGRYAYSQQPSIGMWNLERLLICFMNRVPKEKLESILGIYPEIFEKEFTRIGREKLGLKLEQEGDNLLFTRLLQVMDKLSLDFTFTFRQLSNENMKPFWDYYGNREEMKEWITQYEARLALESGSTQERYTRMKQVNPKYILKNYIAQEVIVDVEQGNSGRLNDWLKVFYSPFEEHTEFEKYAMPTPSEHKHYEVSCSS
ncbi:MAG TPA: YdiU family protein [Bacteriovoracaceae bacterium]|nr:YdiU family protein [Bacteriovoracaceae bacterium]